MSPTTAAFLAFLSIAAGCDLPIWGNGNPVTREREIAEFTAIEVSMAIDVDLEVVGESSGAARRKQAGGTTARLRCDSNLVDRIETVVEDGVLYVRAEDDDESLNPRSTCELVVATSRLEKIEVYGPGTIVANGIDSTELVVEVEGPAELMVAGVVEHLDVDLEGPAELDAESLEARSVDLVAEGPVEAEVRVTESCSLVIEGPAEIDVHGHPDDRDVDVEGPAEVRFR
jgi:hypothetical protein